MRCATAAVDPRQELRVRLSRPSTALHAVVIRLQLAERQLSEGLHASADDASKTRRTRLADTRRSSALLAAGTQPLPGLPAPLLSEKDVRQEGRLSY